MFQYIEHGLSGAVAGGAGGESLRAFELFTPELAADDTHKLTIFLFILIG